jgi:hypothetical protein
MRKYRGDPKFSPGILDTMAMAPAVARRSSSTEQKEKMAAQIAAREQARRASYDPATGVSYAA